MLRSFQLVSAKPMLIVVNVGEDMVATADPRPDEGIEVYSSSLG